MKFKDLNLNQELIDRLDELKFYDLTAPQMTALPLGLRGGSFILDAPTGTGKTFCYALPILNRYHESRYIKHLIIVPTLELSLQVEAVFKSLKKESQVERAVGGIDKTYIMEKEQKGLIDILIASLDSLCTLIDEYNINLSHVDTFVLDEADLIFDDENSLINVDKVASRIPSGVQVMITSATLPAPLKNQLSTYFGGMEKISVNEGLTDKITHNFLKTPADKKVEQLEHLVSIINPYLCLVFVDKLSLNKVLDAFKGNKIKVVKLSVDTTKEEREKIFKRINSGKVQYIISTDVASRGLDFDGTSHVINFDLPKTMDAYIHRSGRCGRSKYTGEVYSFYTPGEESFLKALKEEGIKLNLLKIKNNTLIADVVKERPKSFKKTIEEEVHAKTPVPKKVKPGYKKKRLEKINKEIKHRQKDHIKDIYKARAKRSKH